jgi:hypothetical protein
MRRSLLTFAAGAAAATLLSTVTAVASTASNSARPVKALDGTAPSLRVEPVSFIVGLAIDAAVPFDPKECDIDAWHNAVPMRLSWGGADGRKAVDHYDVWAIPSFTEEYEVLSDTDKTELDVLGGNYDSSCGGQSTDLAYRVEAYDRAGNAALARGDTNTYMGVWQEDGSTVPSVPPGSLTTTRTGLWKVASCTCSDAGQTLYSVIAGETATFKVTPQHAGQWFAIVMPRGPNRGEATITVDGGPAVTVDTYNEFTENRIVVWQTQLSRKTHTVVVTNGGTAGRSRIDLDAVLIS